MYNNPFPNIKLGLQHGSYNTPARDYCPIGDAREIETVDRNPYQYKYQGQERQDELGLNWDSFKWRNYDYAIGRFMSVDPLAEKYSYQSPYNFSENRVVDGNELEGLEWEPTPDKENHFTLRVTPIQNNTQHFQVTDQQVAALQDSFKKGVEEYVSGTLADGNNLTVEVVFDPEAAITLEINDSFDFEGTDKQDVGDQTYADLYGDAMVDTYFNSQENRIQFNAGNLFDDDNGNPAQPTDSQMKRLGAHEASHTAGSRHSNSTEYNNVGGTKLLKSLRQNMPNVQNNIMKQGGTGTNFTPEQRSQMIINILEDRK